MGPLLIIISVKMPTLDPEVIGGGIIHNNKIWLIKKIVNHLIIRDWNCASHSVIFRKWNYRPPLVFMHFLVKFCRSSTDMLIQTNELRLFLADLFKPFPPYIVCFTLSCWFLCSNNDKDQTVSFYATDQMTKGRSLGAWFLVILPAWNS